MAGGGVQFYGIEKVLDMFDSRAVSLWSIWHGKEFQFKGDGDAELRTILNALENAYNDPIYTLRVYEDLKDVKDIKNNTPHDGSFNFRLKIPQEVSGLGYSSPNNYALIKRIEELEKEKTEIQEEDPEEEQTIQGAIGNAVVQAIEDPDLLLKWVTVIKGLFNNTPAAPPTIIRQLDAPASLGKVGNTETAQPIDEVKWTRIYSAIESLDKVDDKLTEHLEKLAIMAQDKPQKLKSLLLMLETF